MWHTLLWGVYLGVPFLCERRAAVVDAVAKATMPFLLLWQLKYDGLAGSLVIYDMSLFGELAANESLCGVNHNKGRVGIHGRAPGHRPTTSRRMEGFGQEEAYEHIKGT